MNKVPYWGPLSISLSNMQPGRWAVATGITFFFFQLCYRTALCQVTQRVNSGPSSPPPAKGYLSGYPTQQDYQSTTPAVRRDKAWLEIKATPWWSKNEEEPGGVAPGFPISPHPPPKLWVFSSHSDGHFIHYALSSPNPLWKETTKQEVNSGLRGNL